MTTAMTTVLATTFSLLLCWWLVFELYRKYRLALFRQRLFAIRDELFDLALAGEVPFDAPVYGLLRSTINGFIRFSSRMTFASILTTLLALPREAEVVGTAYGRRLERGLEALPDATRAKLLHLLDRVHLEATEQFILGSPIFLLLVVPVFVMAVLRHLGTRVTTMLRQSGAARLVYRVDEMAEAVGAI